jgi:PAS domain-containing protein
VVTLAEIVRWVLYTLRDLFCRLAARLLRRDVLLAGSERRFRALLDSAPDAVVTVSRHGHIALADAQAEKMFGWDRSELIGQHVTTSSPRGSGPGTASTRSSTSSRGRPGPWAPTVSTSWDCARTARSSRSRSR